MSSTSYLVIKNRRQSINGVMRRFQELIEIIPKSKFKRKKRKYPRAIFFKTDNPEVDAKRYVKSESKLTRERTPVKKLAWNFERLPDDQLEAVKQAIEIKDVKTLDEIRIKYSLAAKCLTCTYSHESWLMTNFKLLIQLQ